MIKAMEINNIGLDRLSLHPELVLESFTAVNSVIGLMQSICKDR